MQYSVCLPSVRLCEFHVHVLSLSTASDHHLKFADKHTKKRHVMSGAGCHTWALSRFMTKKQNASESSFLLQ